MKKVYFDKIECPSQENDCLKYLVLEIGQMPANLKTINITSRHNTEKKYISNKNVNTWFQRRFFSDS